MPFLRARLFRMATNSRMLLEGMNACLRILSFGPMMSVSCLRLERSEVRSLSVAARWRLVAVSVAIFVIFPETNKMTPKEIVTTARAMRMCFPKCVKRFFVVNIILMSLATAKVYRTRVFQAKRYAERHAFLFIKIGQRKFNFGKHCRLLQCFFVII